MGIFTDDFQRANGSLGGNWTANRSNVEISNGWVLCTAIAYWYAYETTLDGSGARVQARATVNARYGAVAYNGPIVKLNPATNNGYFAHVSYAAGVYSLKIGKGAVTGAGSTATANLPYAPTGIFDIVLTWDNGVLTAEIPGIVTVTTNDADYAAHAGFGVKGFYNSDLIGAVTFTAGTSPTLTVSPSPIGNYGATVALAFAGTETTWDTTDPTFTVGDGTLSDITITSDTTATATYDPGTFLGTTTFTDPSTGATDDVLVTSDPGVVPPADQCPFTEGAVAMVNDTASHSDGDLITLDMTLIPGMEGFDSVALGDALTDLWIASFRYTGEPPAGYTGGSLLYKLWQLINGTTEPAVGPWQHASGVPLSEQLGDLLVRWGTLITANDYTLGDVITTLAGEGVPTHKDILDGLGELAAPDLDPVLDAIAALRGDEIATVAQIVDILGQIRTINTWHLGNVKDWVEGVQGTNAPTIHDVRDDIAALNNAPAADLEPVLQAVADGTAVSQGALDLLTAFLVPEAATVQTILDAIEAIQSGTAADVPPIWLGTARETLGEPVALTTQLVLDGPMDGVLIDITTPPERLGRYLVGGETLDYGVGRITFGQEGGYLEMWQYLSFRKAIYTPKTMTQATHAYFQVLGGAEGTATTFIRS
jgi:hypothetical protein